IGGLMAPHASMPVYDSIRQVELTEPSFDKARAIGEQIARWSVAALEDGDTIQDLQPLRIEAKSVTLPVKNPVFRIASSIGLLRRGMTGWFKATSEVAALRIGPATWLSIPGEIYPEIVFGGVESPPGQDYAIDPIETPPLNDFMHGKYHYYIGLSNDEVGYIIPKSQWDNKKPWLYLDERETYGEVNSLGPETAPILYEGLKEVLQKLKKSDVVFARASMAVKSVDIPRAFVIRSSQQ